MDENRTNCPNCGAPLKDGICQYCGTEKAKNVESYITIDSNSIRVGVIVPENYNRKNIVRGV